MDMHRRRKPVSLKSTTWWRFLVTVTVVFGMLVASCGSSPASSPITVDAETAHQLMLTGVNMTGITAPTEEWVRVARRGCDNGAWDWTVAKEEGDAATDVVGKPLPPDVVWILTVMACHDLVPATAIRQGPPS
ncbi:MAG: hypothetical protein GXP34_03090 [Actinobacteria bacterium]|nr:hypothetical protein [Actinomycetota bacterium]